MKINSVHLQNSCCELSPGGSTRRGFLYKKSESSRSYHRRWFHLRDNLLFYFSHKRLEDLVNATPVGLIVLEGCCVERRKGLSFQLTFPGSGERKYVLAAETEEEREDWMQAMISAGYGFMQYAISEMEQTIRALEVAGMDQQWNTAPAQAPSSIAVDMGQKATMMTTRCFPVEELKGGEAMSLNDPPPILPPSALSDNRGASEDSVPGNSRLVFERMHLRFREEIKRKSKEQHKQTYCQQ